MWNGKKDDRVFRSLDYRLGKMAKKLLNLKKLDFSRHCA